MKIDVTLTDQGKTEKIDFEGAILPNGRVLQTVLDENEKFKEEIKGLKEKTSFLAKIIPWKYGRDAVEIVLLIWGIYTIYSWIKGLM